MVGIREGDDTDIVREFYAAYNAHDPRAAAALYRLDGVHEDCAVGAIAQGREQIAGSLEHFLQSIPDALWDPREVYATGSCVAVVYRLTGSLRQPLGGFPARGQSIVLTGVHVFDVGGDMLIRSRDIWNVGDFVSQARS